MNPEHAELGPECRFTASIRQMQLRRYDNSCIESWNIPGKGWRTRAGFTGGNSVRMEDRLGGLDLSAGVWGAAEARAACRVATSGAG